jgi:hypothetical protein
MARDHPDTTWSYQHLWIALDGAAIFPRGPDLVAPSDATRKFESFRRVAAANLPVGCMMWATAWGLDARSSPAAIGVQQRCFGRRGRSA